MKKHQSKNFIEYLNMKRYISFVWNVSGIETPKEINVPGVWDIYFIHVAQSIRPWSGDRLDDEGALLG